MAVKYTTIKIQKTTTELLKKISLIRGRRESQEQVILELLDFYNENKLKNKESNER
jgi:hypothetical protein